MCLLEVLFCNGTTKMNFFTLIKKRRKLLLTSHRHKHGKGVALVFPPKTGRFYCSKSANKAALLPLVNAKEKYHKPQFKSKSTTGNIILFF